MMKIYFLSIALTLLISTFLHAQVGKVGINTTAPAAILHVKDSSVLFSGINPLPATPGKPPVSGPGTRMMWYPDKAAFRAGRVTNIEWDKINIGSYSIAFGLNSKATAEASVAMGNNSIASDSYSTAMGDATNASGHTSTSMGSGTNASGGGSTAMGIITTASGTASTAMGSSTTASGSASTAMGQGTTASGFRSTAMGDGSSASGTSSTAIGNNTMASGSQSMAIGDRAISSGVSSIAVGFHTTANSYASTVMGAYNDTTSISSTTWNLLDPLFIIGNGTANNARKNAMTILKNGNTGIGIVSPQRLFHVRAGSSGATPLTDAVAVIEDDTDAFINIITPSTDQSGIFFGNPANAAHGGIAYNSQVANGLDFRTNGNNTKAVITDIGNMGIGDDSPNARLHVANGVSGGIYHSQSELIIEDNENSYIQFSTPTAEEAGFLSGNSLTSIRSAIIFTQDSAVDIRSGGNSTRIKIAKNGNIGIGTLTPAAKLNVNGSTILGTNGTALNEIIKATIAKDVASIAAGGSLNVDFSVGNSALTSTVYISPELDLPNGMLIGYARVQAAGTVRVRFTNISTGAIDLSNMNYYITVIR